MQPLLGTTENGDNINSNWKQIIVEGVAHCTAESSLQLSSHMLKILEKAVESKGDVAEESSETLNILEKAVEAKGDLAENMDWTNIMMVQQLPLLENFAKIVLKEWFDKGDLFEITDTFVLQKIKEKIDKGSNDEGEMDGVKESRVLHAEGLVSLEIGLWYIQQQKEATPTDVMLLIK